MEQIQIFIDYAGGENPEYTDMLISQLSKIGDNVKVVTYDDISIDDHNPEAWEQTTLNAIKNSKIIIPFLTPSYLEFVSKDIGNEFRKVIDSNDKYLFPIMIEESDWSSFNWVVRSNIFPSDGTSISEFSDAKIRSIFSHFVSTIKNAINQASKPASTSPRPISSQKLNRSIFISHSHSDADFAELLKLKLEKRGIEAWIDNERLKIGQDWREEIDSGIENSMAVIAIMSPDARKSEYVTYEWAFAWGKGKKIFPLMLEQTQLHPRLESLQYMDFTNRASRPWDELIESIIKQMA